MTTVNLLPWREARRRQRAQRFYGILGGALVVAALVVLAGHFAMAAQIQAQEARNDFLEQEISRVERQIEEIEQLEREKERLMARMEVVQRLQQDRAFTVRILDQLARSVPDGVRLRNISYNGNRIELTGNAESNARVSQFMRMLEDAPVMDDPTLGSIDSDNDRSFQFTLHVTPEREDPAAAEEAGR